MSEPKDVEPIAMLLCSQCYDARQCKRFTATVPRSTCAVCGRRCLGFLTEGRSHGDAVDPRDGIA